MQGFCGRMPLHLEYNPRQRRQPDEADRVQLFQRRKLRQRKNNRGQQNRRHVGVEEEGALPRLGTEAARRP